jgi:hypothetical protein
MLHVCNNLLHICTYRHMYIYLPLSLYI